MDETHKIMAQKCLDGAYNATMDFSGIVKTLSQNGFESYHVDYLRGTATYYLLDGGNFEISLPPAATRVAKEFAAAAVQSAVQEAQRHIPGYTYKGFCEKVMAAGCAGYIVSFPGKRVMYVGRTAETHVEHFPQ